MESYWAYPGPRLMATVRESIDEANAGVFARLVQKISNSLLTGGYRHDSAACFWGQVFIFGVSR
jgi:arginine decarboxylase